MRPKPFDGIGERLFGRGLGEAEFADGFGGIEEHGVCRHPHSRERSSGRLAGEPGDGLVHTGRHPCDAVGNLEFRSGHAGDFLQHRERFFHRPVSFRIAENVTFADAAFFGCEDVTDGDIPDVDPIESGIEVGGHLAVQEIDDDLAGGRWFDIARADGGARIDNYDGRTFGGEFARDLFGAPLGDFVVVRELALLDGRDFVGRRRQLATDVLRQSDAAHGARIDDARATGLRGGFEDVAGAIDIGDVHRRVILEPKMITRGDVKAPIAPAQAGGDRGAVGDVAVDALKVHASEAADICGGTQEGLDAMAPRDQFLDEIGADKARSPGDETLHSARSVKQFCHDSTRLNCKLDLRAWVTNHASSRMPLKNCARKKLSREEAKDLDVKIGFMEGVVRRDPAFVEALQILGDDYTRRGKFVAGLKVDEQLSQLRPDDPSVQYNLACSYSLTGNFNQAIAALEQALNLGFDDFKWLARDPDLTGLRQHPLYKNIRAKVRKMKARKA